MTLFDIVGLISDAGVSIAIVGVFIFIYLRNERIRSRRADANAKQNKKERDHQSELFEKLMENQQSQLKELTNIVGDLAKNNSSFSHEDEEIQAQIDDQIDSILAELREETLAGRALLIRYHNGTKDILGNSFLRLSCTNERVAVGVSPFKTQFQNQFRTLVGHLCNEVRDNGHYYIPDIEILRREKLVTMYEFFKTRNIVGTMAQAVFSDNGYVIGFILVEFLVSCPVYEALETPMKNASKEISRLLTLKTGGK